VTEYVTTLEVWFEADSAESAGDVSNQLRDVVKAHPRVSEVETQQPEEL
jgi:hypothetical protein